jgi:rare lipoprotein A
MYRATMKPYTVMGKRYCPTVVKIGDKFKGTASWYGDDFHGRQTSNGEYYNMHDHTAAHKTLPINTLVKITNLRNNKTTTVRINDRGPFVDNRIIDLSYQAARDIDMIKEGTAPVLLEVVEFDESANKYAHKQAVVIADKQPKKSVWKRFNPENEQKVVSGGEYSIQIASLSNKERATALKEKCYNGNGNYNSHIKEKIYNGQTIYKVMLSGFKSIKEAKDFISKAHYQGAFVIRN